MLNLIVGKFNIFYMISSRLAILLEEFFSLTSFPWQTLVNLGYRWRIEVADGRSCFMKFILQMNVSSIAAIIGGIFCCDGIAVCNQSICKQ